MGLPKPGAFAASIPSVNPEAGCGIDDVCFFIAKPKANLRSLLHTGCKPNRSKLNQVQTDLPIDRLG